MAKYWVRLVWNDRPIGKRLMGFLQVYNASKVRSIMRRTVVITADLVCWMFGGTAATNAYSEAGYDTRSRSRCSLRKNDVAGRNLKDFGRDNMDTGTATSIWHDR